MKLSGQFAQGVPRSPFRPDPKAPTNRATTNAPKATRKAYCTVDAPTSERARRRTVSHAPCAMKNPRRTRSVTPPPFALTDHEFELDYLVSRRKCVPVPLEPGAAAVGSEESDIPYPVSLRQPLRTPPALDDNELRPDFTRRLHGKNPRHEMQPSRYRIAMESQLSLNLTRHIRGRRGREPVDGCLVDGDDRAEAHVRPRCRGAGKWELDTPEALRIAVGGRGM